MRRHATALWHGSGLENDGTLTTSSGVLSSRPFSFKPRCAVRAAGWFVLAGLLGVVTPAFAQPRLADVPFGMTWRSDRVIASPAGDGRTGGVPPVTGAIMLELALPPTFAGVPTPTTRSLSLSIDPEHDACRTSWLQTSVTGAIGGGATAFLMHALILGGWASNRSDATYRRSRNHAMLFGAASGAVVAPVAQAVTCRSGPRGRG